MAKTTFTNNVSKIFAPFLNLVYNHLHDGVNNDGHCGKIDLTAGNHVSGKLPQDMCLAVPLGAIIPYISAVAPSGYLACDGTTFNATTYADLAALLGGNIVPDLRGRFILGVSSIHALKSIGGEETHVLTVDELASHTHKIVNGSNVEVGIGIDTGTENIAYKIPDATMSNTSISIKSAGTSVAHNNMPPFFCLIYIIRAI